MSGHVVVRATSRRAERRVAALDGAVGPYKAPTRAQMKLDPSDRSIFDMLDSAYALPEASAALALTIPGVVAVRHAKPADLKRYMFQSKTVPNPDEIGADQ
jgi:hypothetical protein